MVGLRADEVSRGECTAKGAGMHGWGVGESPTRGAVLAPLESRFDVVALKTATVQRFRLT